MRPDMTLIGHSAPICLSRHPFTPYQCLIDIEQVCSRHADILESRMQRRVTGVKEMGSWNSAHRLRGLLDLCSLAGLLQGVCVDGLEGPVGVCRQRADGVPAAHHARRGGWEGIVC